MFKKKCDSCGAGNKVDRWNCPRWNCPILELDDYQDCWFPVGTLLVWNIKEINEKEIENIKVGLSEMQG